MARGSAPEKVTRLGIDRSAPGLIAFTSGAVVRFEEGKRPFELARPKVVQEEGWIYYVDGDGDLARSPRPNWQPPAAVRKRLVARPLAIFRDIPTLAALPFTGLAVSGSKIHESAALEPDRAAAVWRAAQPRARTEGFTAVLVSERIRGDYFDALETIVKRDRKELSKLDIKRVLAKRERPLMKDPATVRMRRDLANAHIAIPRTTPKRSYSFEENTPRLYLTLLPCEPWEVPLYLPVGGVNGAPTSVEIAAVLRSWATDWDPAPIYVNGLTFELEPRRGGTADAIRALAWQHYVVSTDIVNQGTRTLTVLARELAKGRWFFWWD